MKLIADLLYLQDPKAPHTLLTRVLVSVIIIGTNLVYAGFFGVIGAVAVYLLGVELLGIDPQWAVAPLGVAVVAGLVGSRGSIRDYWRNYGH